MDADDTTALEAAVAARDIVVSLIPYTYHAAVIKAAIKGKINVVTTSSVHLASHSGARSGRKRCWHHCHE